MKKFLFVCLMVFFFFGTASAADKDRERIDGVAKFLLDRANANSLYIFEKKMKSNKALKLYLPTVYRYLEDYGLYVLMQSSPDIWKRKVEKDLDDLLDRYDEILKKDNPLKQSQKFIKVYDSSVGDLQFNVNGVSCQMAGRPSEDSPCFKKHIEISQDYATTINKLFNILVSERTFEEKKAEIGAINNSVGEILLKYDIVNGEEIKKKIEGATDLYTKVIKGDQKIYTEIAKLIWEYRDAKLTMDKVDISLRVIKQMYGLYTGDDLFPKAQDREVHEKYFERYKRYALMFAHIADADNADNVKAILTAYTLPPVSFGVKREEGIHLTIASYLGISGGLEINDHPVYASLIAPIGFEVSRALKQNRLCGILKKNGSLGLFISVIDFGSAVSAQIYDSEHDLEIRDLFAPGVFGVYGFPDLPLAIGIGYQNTKSLMDVDRTAHHISLFIAFDMPLIRIGE